MPPSNLEGGVPRWLVNRIDSSLDLIRAPDTVVPVRARPEQPAVACFVTEVQ
jgi:hypothetical protein